MSDFISRLGVFAGTAACLAACSAETPSREEVAGPPVAYVGVTTDEALLHLLDIPARDVASQRLTLLSPSLSAALASATPATFAFGAASSAGLENRGRAMSPAPAQRENWLAWFHPIRVAHAHGKPFNGAARWLVFADASGEAVLRVFTDQTSFTPGAASWAALAAGQQPLSLRIVSAFFVNNEVTADGGPYVGGHFEFSIQ